MYEIEERIFSCLSCQVMIRISRLGFKDEHTRQFSINDVPWQ